MIHYEYIRFFQISLAFQVSPTQIEPKFKVNFILKQNLKATKNANDQGTKAGLKQ